MVRVWLGVCSCGGLDTSRVSAVGTKLSNVLVLAIGTAVFNSSVITSIPSWGNEKQEEDALMIIPARDGRRSADGAGTLHAHWNLRLRALNLLQRPVKDRHPPAAEFPQRAHARHFCFFPCAASLTSIPVFAVHGCSAAICSGRRSAGQ
jgi:hypothetical protein